MVCFRVFYTEVLNDDTEQQDGVFLVLQLGRLCVALHELEELRPVLVGDQDLAE